MTTLCLCDLVETSADRVRHAQGLVPEPSLVPQLITAPVIAPLQARTWLPVMRASAVLATALLIAGCQEINASKIDAPFMTMERTVKRSAHGDVDSTRDDTVTVGISGTESQVDGVAQSRLSRRLTPAESDAMITRAIAEFHVGSAQLISSFRAEKQKCAMYAHDVRLACLNAAEAGRAATQAAVLTHRANALLAASFR